MKKKAASALCRKFKFYHLVKRSLCMAHTVSSRIIAGGDNVFFLHKKGVIIRGKANILDFAQWKLCPKYFCTNQKIVTSN